jgi:hypothetical protein
LIQLILFLFIGVLLLGTLLVLARRGPRAEGSAQALVDARHALNALQLDLLPTELVGRIFAKQDCEYVALRTPPPVQRMFQRERKRIALSWVHQVQGQIRSLRRFHLGAARFYAQLNVRAEMRLALDFAVLLMACRTLQVMLYLRGPYAVPRMVGATAAAAARVCNVSEKSLSFLKPAHAGTFLDRSAGGVML